MTVYVIEIKGRGVAAFHADDDAHADARARDLAVRDDLMVLATNGLALWDGVTEVRIRRALPGEEAAWRASRLKAYRQGNIDENDDDWIAYLVALTDPGRRKLGGHLRK